MRDTPIGVLALTDRPISPVEDRLSGACAIAVGVIGQLVFVTMPFFLALVKQDRHFSESEISLLSSADMLGMFLASLAAVLWIGRSAWRRAALLALALLMGATLLSLSADAILPFAALRILCGFGAGSLMAIGMSAMGERKKADAWFGWYLATLSLAGMATSYAIPRFVQPYGLAAYLIALMVLYAPLVIVIAGIPQRSRKAAPKEAAVRTDAPLLLAVLSLAAIFFFGTSIFATWSHLQLIGEARGFAPSTGGDAMSLGFLLGIPVSIAAGLLPGRVHRVALFALLALLHLGGLLLMVSYGAPFPFQAAILLIGVGWSFASPLQVGLTASLDSGGRFVVLFVAAMKISYVFAGAMLALLLQGEASSGRVILFSLVTGAISIALYLYLAWRSPGVTSRSPAQAAPLPILQDI